MGTFMFLRLIRSGPIFGSFAIFFLLELLLLALSNPLDFRPSVRQAARSGCAHQAGETTEQRHRFGTRERERKEVLGIQAMLCTPWVPAEGRGALCPPARLQHCWRWVGRGCLPWGGGAGCCDRDRAALKPRELYKEVCVRTAI